MDLERNNFRDWDSVFGSRRCKFVFVLHRDLKRCLRSAEIRCSRMNSNSVIFDHLRERGNLIPGVFGDIDYESDLALELDFRDLLVMLHRILNYTHTFYTNLLSDK